MTDVEPKATDRRDSTMMRWRWRIMIAGPVAIVALVAFLILNSGKSQSTENAYVQIARTAVAPSISGRVVEIKVQENQLVKQGQVLFRLDARDLAVGLTAANAQLASAELAVAQQRATYRRETANLAAAEETLSFANSEAERQKKLLAAGLASDQQYDQAVHAAQQAKQQLAAAQQQVASALAALGGNPDLADQAPSVLLAKAQLDRAQLNSSYSEIIAPSDGVVARVDQLPVGAYLNASQPAFWLLSGEPWIEANFKEDQVAKMRVGQPVLIHIDAFPGGDLKGHVASFAPGTGSAFSPLPAQNATGNWVKVTQRLQVRIAFDSPPPGMAARAGLSARVKVDVRPQAGRS